MASEVASAQVAVFPVFTGFRRKVTAEVDGSLSESEGRFTKGFKRIGDSSGQSAGKGFKDSFKSSSAGAYDSALKDANKEIASSSKELSGLRLKEQDATGKVRVAEVALAEARTKTGNASARSIAAEERLASAQRGLSSIQDTVRASSDRLAAAKGNLTNIIAQGVPAVEKSSGGFRNLLSSLSSGGFQAAGSAIGGVTRVVGGLALSVGSVLVKAVSAAAGALLNIGKVGVGAFAAMVTAIGGLAIKGGITRLLDIENAQAKLSGLGNSTEAIAEIMKNALDAVSDTAFGLGEAATVAASAVAAGIQPGEELTKYLKLTADTATIAGVSLSEMGSIINKTSTAGRVFTDDLNQLADRGIPIFQYLQKEYGVSAEELRKMVEAGEVDSATFRKVLEENIGGAALSAGDTTVGAFANMRAALSRFGAKLVGESLPQFKDFFTKVGDFFDSLGPKAESMGTKIGAGVGVALGVIGKVLDVITLIAQSDEGFSLANIRAQFSEAFPALDNFFKILDILAPLAPIVGDALSMLAPVLAPLLPIIQQAAEDLLPHFVDAIAEILPQLIPLIPALAEAAIELLPALADVIIALLPILPPLAELIGALAPVIVLLTPLITELAEKLTATLDAANVLADFFNGDISLQTAGDKALALSGQYGNLGQIIHDKGEKMGQDLRSLSSYFADMNTNTTNSAQSAGRSFGQFAFDVGVNIAAAGAGVGQLAGQVDLALTRAVVTARGYAGDFLSAGRSIMGSFVDGIQEKISEVKSAVADAMAAAAALLPHSPAKEGPFSGSGWTRVEEGGEALMNQFRKGIDKAGVGASLSASLGSLNGDISTSGAVARSERSGVSVDAPANYYGDVHVTSLEELDRERNLRQRDALALAGIVSVGITS